MKVLVVAVHPDDETLGCGGTILKHKDNNDSVDWLILTRSFNEEFNTIREKEIEQVSELYRFNKVFKMGWEATKLDRVSFSEIVDKAGKVISESKPDIIYLPHPSDIHTDHQVAFKAIYSCTKSFRYPFIKKILAMETLSETEFSPPINNSHFNPNYFVNIEKHLQEKLNIFKLYKSEVQLAPSPRSLDVIKSLAKFRGSSCNSNYAECFVLLKEIVS